METTVKRRPYSQKEEEYIRNKHNELYPAVLAKRLGRSESGVRSKVIALGLPLFKESGEYITRTEVQKTLGVSSSTLASWEEKGYISFKRDKEKFGIFAMISICDLISFLKAHQDIWDSRRLPVYALGMEPVWLQQKRVKDTLKQYDTKKHGHRFSVYEDLEVRAMVRRKFTIKEIAEKLGRSESSIRGRVRRLRDGGDAILKEAAIKKKKWTDKEVEKLISLHKSGQRLPKIAKTLKRTVYSVENRVRLLKKEGRI